MDDFLFMITVRVHVVVGVSAQKIFSWYDS